MATTRILILADDFAPYLKGGAGVVAGELAEGLQNRGHTVEVISTHQDYERGDFVFEKGSVRVHFLYTPKPSFLKNYTLLYNPRLIRRLIPIVRAFRPDMVSCHNINNALSFYVLKVCYGFTSRVYYTAHDVMPVSPNKLDTYRYLDLRDPKVFLSDKLRWSKFTFNPIRELGAKYFLKNYARSIVCVSKELRRVLLANGVSTRSVVIYNGFRRYHVLSSFDRKRLQMQLNPSRKHIILLVGRVSRHKGFDATLAALDKVYQQYKNFVLITTTSQAPVVRPWLHNIGWQSREYILELIQMSQLVLTPSLYCDPFPSLNIEAMMYGRPVISTIFGGAPEAVVDNVTGFLVDPRKTGLFATKILELLQDPKKNRAMGEQAYLRYRERFQVDRMLDDYESLFFGPIQK